MLKISSKDLAFVFSNALYNININIKNIIDDNIGGTKEACLDVFDNILGISLIALGAIAIINIIITCFMLILPSLSSINHHLSIFNASNIFSTILILYGFLKYTADSINTIILITMKIIISFLDLDFNNVFKSNNINIKNIR
ncbi:hypothetical protein D3C73_1315990 [compost metagenome]